MPGTSLVHGHIHDAAHHIGVWTHVIAERIRLDLAKLSEEWRLISLLFHEFLSGAVH